MGAREITIVSRPENIDGATAGEEVKVDDEEVPCPWRERAPERRVRAGRRAEGINFLSAQIGPRFRGGSDFA
jgi:hypothetical protein